jgi:predicted DNA-binding WGR domain protein
MSEPVTRLVGVEDGVPVFKEFSTRGNVLIRRWGRIGTPGVSKEYPLRDAKRAKERVPFLVDFYRGRGFVEDDGSLDALAEKQRTRGAAKGAKAKDNAAPLFELATLLARRDSKGLVTELGLAVEDPLAYYDRFAKRLAERGIGSPDRDFRKKVPWLALVDGLMSRESLVEIDWREEPGDAAPRLRTIADVGKKWWRWVDELGEVATADFLTECARRLGAEKLVLAEIDLGSDSYPLVVYSAKLDAQVRSLAAKWKKLGFGKVTYFERKAGR